MCRIRCVLVRFTGSYFGKDRHGTLQTALIHSESIVVGASRRLADFIKVGSGLFDYGPHLGTCGRNAWYQGGNTVFRLPW